MFILLNKKYIFSVILMIFFVLFSFNTAFAVEGIGKAGTELGTFAGTGGAGYVTGGEGQINIIIGNIIKALLSFLGVVFLILLVYGGFVWMKARGDDSEVKKAKDIMINATLGLIVVLGAYAATAWIIGSLVGNSLTP